MGIYRKGKRRISRFLSTNGLLIFWSIMNIVVFVTTFNKYKQEPRFYYLRQMIGFGLCVSRASGAIINISCSLMLLPMCRCCATILRQCFHRIPMCTVKSLIDHSKAIHITCAFTVALASVIHALAHVVNAINFCHHYNSDHPDLNVAEFSGQSPFRIFFTTVAGITGNSMLLVLFAIVLMSLKSVRNRYYNGFWYVHRLFIVFVGLLVCHPLGGLLKEQVNVDGHPPGCLTNDTNDRVDVRPSTSYKASNCTIISPRFSPQKSTNWLWITIPLFIYTMDLAYRFLVRSQSVDLVQVNQLPCSVLELTLQKRGFSCKPGQYILLQCPDVSTLEWHPFSVSSCRTHQPQDKFRVHLKTYGDWSRMLRDRLIDSLRPDEHVLPVSHRWSNICLHIDGPFSSPLEDVTNCPISMCIAGGIGVTPFASIFENILTDQDTIKRIRRLHFVWVCREVESLFWFSQLLFDLHFKLWNANQPDLLEIRLYVTRRFDKDKIKPLFGKYYQWLIRRINFGRPCWKTVFCDLTLAYTGKHVRVFCCGPKSLNRQIHRICSANKDNTKMSFYHESFS